MLCLHTGYEGKHNKVFLSSHAFSLIMYHGHIKTLGVLQPLSLTAFPLHSRLFTHEYFLAQPQAVHAQLIVIHDSVQCPSRRPIVVSPKYRGCLWSGTRTSSHKTAYRLVILSPSPLLPRSPRCALEVRDLHLPLGLNLCLPLEQILEVRILVGQTCDGVAL